MTADTLEGRRLRACLKFGLKVRTLRSVAVRILVTRKTSHDRDICNNGHARGVFGADILILGDPQVAGHAVLLDVARPRVIELQRIQVNKVAIEVGLERPGQYVTPGAARFSLREILILI